MTATVFNFFFVFFFSLRSRGRATSNRTSASTSSFASAAFFFSSLPDALPLYNQTKTISISNEKLGRLLTNSSNQSYIEHVWSTNYNIRFHSLLLRGGGPAFTSTLTLTFRKKIAKLCNFIKNLYINDLSWHITQYFLFQFYVFKQLRGVLES